MGSDGRRGGHVNASVRRRLGGNVAEQHLDEQTTTGVVMELAWNAGCRQQSRRWLLPTTLMLLSDLGTHA